MVEMPQRLVAPQRVRVVVRVPLQMKQRPVGEQVVAVPRVVWLAGLVAAAGVLRAQQAVVLYVVGRGELKVGPERGHYQKRQHEKAQPQGQGGP
ncbi:hypothetical protein D3C72_2067860 [compost metagenome]